MSESDSPRRAGALRSPDDEQDCIYEHLAQAPPGFYHEELPEEFDLRKHASPPRDQGERGTCAAFAAAIIKEMQERRDGELSPPMSPEFLYYHRKNKPVHGMYGRDVFRIMQNIGCVSEDSYPYGTAEKPGSALYKAAAQHRISMFARVTSIDGLKRALIESGPCYIQMPLYNYNPFFWRRDTEEETTLGHALVVVGYNKYGFILRNSWGSDWGVDGDVLFPYAEWSVHWECWVAITETIHVDEGSDEKIDRSPCVIL